MDGKRFDRLTRSLASGSTRRGVLRGVVGGVAALATAALGRPGDADAQSQAQCGNKACASNPGVCSSGCVCCLYPNGTNRCTTAANCRAGTVVTATTTTPSGPPTCISSADCPTGFACVNGICSPNGPGGFRFDAPAAKVWDALTDAESLDRLGMRSDIAPRVGHRFQVRPARDLGSDLTIDAEIIDVEPMRRLSFNWLNGPHGTPVTVTFTLVSEDDGAATRIRLTHTDNTGESCRASARVLGAHWGPNLFLDALPAHLAKAK